MVPFVVGCALLAVLYPPLVARSHDDRFLDVALIGLVGVAGFQMVPLPSPLVDLISPGTSALLSELELGFAASAARGESPRTLATSVEPGATLWAVSVLLAAILLFLVARQWLEGRSLRAFVRAVAWLGLIVALLALAQKATADGLVYWWWEPFDEGSEPFGPFLNRNHFGTWAIMATPLCLGHALARLQAVGSPGRMPLAGPAFRFDERAAFMIFVATVLSTAVVTSLSRSALLGLALSLVVLLVSSSGQGNRRRRIWLSAYMLVTALAIIAWVNTGELIVRLDDTLTGSARRLVIWRESLPIARDFWLTGTGAGTYEKVMLLYQQSNRRFAFNQAHSQYVQVVVEGGALLLIPLACAVWALVAQIARRLASDETPIYWIRAGAVAGLAAVSLQNVWETGLRMPANAALAAVLAAIAVHRSRTGSGVMGDDGVTARD